MALSHSGLTLYDQCPSAFQRRYILKEIAPKKEAHPAARRGKDTHYQIETYLTLGLSADLPDGFDAWFPLFESLRELGATPEREFGLDEDFALVDFASDEAMLRGKIDADYFNEEASRAVVYEWKTGRKYPEHAHQRSLYALAAFVIYPDALEAEVHMPYLDMTPASEVVQTFMRGQMGTLQWIYQRKVNKVQPPQEYPATPSWKCKFCDFSKRHNGGKCHAG